MPDLCTLAGVKAALETTTSASDTKIATYITAASAEIERRYQRQFAQYGASTKVFPVSRGNYIDLAPYELNAVPTTVVLRSPDLNLTYTATNPADYALGPVGGWPGLLTWTTIQLNANLVVAGFALNWGYAELAVTGNWGALTTPPDVVDATIKTVCSWLDIGIAQYGLSDYNQATGHETTPTRFGGYAIPAMAHRILWPYSRDYSSMLG